MEDSKKKQPSLPPNYVSILDLRHQWLLQQQLQAEERAVADRRRDKTLKYADAHPPSTPKSRGLHHHPQPLNPRSGFRTPNLKQDLLGIEAANTEIDAPDCLTQDNQTVRGTRKTPSEGSLRWKKWRDRRNERRNRECRHKRSPDVEGIGGGDCLLHLVGDQAGGGEQKKPINSPWKECKAGKKNRFINGEVQNPVVEKQPVEEKCGGMSQERNFVSVREKRGFSNGSGKRSESRNGICVERKGIGICSGGDRIPKFECPVQEKPNSPSVRRVAVLENPVHQNRNCSVQRDNAVVEKQELMPDKGIGVGNGDCNEKRKSLHEKPNSLLETCSAVGRKGNEEEIRECVVDTGRRVIIGDNRRLETRQSPEILGSVLEKSLKEKHIADSKFEKQNGLSVDRSETEESVGEQMMEVKHKMKDIAVEGTCRRAGTSSMAYDSRIGRPKNVGEGRTYWIRGRGERWAYQNCGRIGHNEVLEEGNSAPEKQNDSENGEWVEKGGQRSSGDCTAEIESSLDGQGVRKSMPQRLTEAENGECVDVEEGEVNLGAWAGEVEHKMKDEPVRGIWKKAETWTMTHGGRRGRAYWTHSRGGCKGHRNHGWIVCNKVLEEGNSVPEKQNDLKNGKCGEKEGLVKGEFEGHQNHGWIVCNEVLEKGNSAAEKQNDLKNGECGEKGRGQVSYADCTTEIESLENLNGVLEMPMPERRKSSIERHNVVKQSSMPQKLNEAEIGECTDNKDRKVNITAEMEEIDHQMKEASVGGKWKKSMAWPVTRDGGTRRGYRSYSRSECRAYPNYRTVERRFRSEIKRKDGLVWVKKSEPSDSNIVI